MGIGMYADIVIRGNAIFDAVQDQPFSGYVAIKDKKILAVGKDAKEAEQYIWQDTKVYDYKDNLVMPGFNDSHLHLTLAAISKMSVDPQLPHRTGDRRHLLLRCMAGARYRVENHGRDMVPIGSDLPCMEDKIL
ncbi:hypothetical protein LJC49_05320 [Ruminococcaceae bacterium OttesenSCG-928-I18]|nr:hypothetical protein [Ruminococcaceae bacterium OttesenSCG-928-I18]